MNKDIIRENLQTAEPADNWNRHVIHYIEKLNRTHNNRELRYLEVGSGLCLFPILLSQKFPNLKITCIEINPDLAEIARSNGFRVICDSVLNIKPEEQYDIVHCSHVIEHFPYPQVSQLLDFLAASTKKEGHLIIRAPLMWRWFLHDLDHVRPYPPEAILNYYRNPQQQKVGNATLSVEDVVYISDPLKLEHLQRWNVLFIIGGPLRRVYNKIIDRINTLNYRLWKRYRYPCEAPRGYILFTTKQS